MTNEEAISLLRRYKRDVYRYNPKYILYAKQNSYFQKCVYGRFLIDQVIEKLQHTEKSVIYVVNRIYSQLDEVLGDSDDDRFITHRFAAVVEYEAGNLLRYLNTIEKEKNEDAKN